VKVTYVVPRYGRAVVGGAEQACRMAAEKLAGRGGWQVEVLTTTAVDSATWAPAEPEGDRVEQGVLVRRYPAEPRHPGFGGVHEAVLEGASALGENDQRRWVDMQGPASAPLLDAIATCDADVVAFTPYLFHPTVHGIHRARPPTVLQPATHDEPAARLPIVRHVFAAADALCFYSDAERRLTDRLFPVAHRRQLVLGLGAEAGAGDAEAFRAEHALGGRPYLVCVGRVDRSKGTSALARAFSALKHEIPGPLALVLVGPVLERPADHPDVVVTGTVDEAAKWGALRGAVALVSPSRVESFSLVLLEAWLAGIPVLVNRACPATRDHVVRSRGGLAFHDYSSFETAVEVLLRYPAARTALAANGLAYVERHYRWPDLIDRYSHFLQTVARHGRR
jgi:glycosyltransferase involved in cell wall biosynthesis